jgi:hypothetical protein
MKIYVIRDRDTGLYAGDISTALDDEKEIVVICNKDVCLRSSWHSSPLVCPWYLEDSTIDGDAYYDIGNAFDFARRLYKIIDGKPEKINTEIVWYELEEKGAVPAPPTFSVTSEELNNILETSDNPVFTGETRRRVDKFAELLDK